MYKGEKFNSISHLVGAALALGAAVLLIVSAAMSSDGARLGSAVVYGLCLFLSFLFSTLYHTLRGTPKKVFQRLDHIGIFLLIAGTYTPYCLVTLADSKGYLVAGLVWGLSLFGIAFKAVFGEKYNLVSTLFYLLCGWTVAFDWQGLTAGFSGPGFDWLVAGGLVYSAGAVFYLLDSRYPRMHAIWHLFVLAAAACHFVSVFFYVL